MTTFLPRPWLAFTALLWATTVHAGALSPDEFSARCSAVPGSSAPLCQCALQQLQTEAAAQRTARRDEVQRIDAADLDRICAQHAVVVALNDAPLADQQQAAHRFRKTEETRALDQLFAPRYGAFKTAALAHCDAARGKLIPDVLASSVLRRMALNRYRCP